MQLLYCIYKQMCIEIRQNVKLYRKLKNQIGNTLPES